MISDVPEVTPTYAIQPPKIDGRMDDPCWQLATPLANFFLNKCPEPAKEQTVARIAYDDRNIYFACECFDSKAGSIDPKYTNDGQPVWLDDCIEILISPYCVATKHNLHHFFVNAAGAKAYLYMEEGQEKENWQAAVQRYDDKWTVEVAIPIAELQPVGRNEDCWRINIGRNTVSSSELSSWAPVPDKFATTWRFGRLRQPDFSPRLITLRSKLAPAAPVANNTGVKPIEKVPESTSPVRPIVPLPREVKWRKSGPFVINKNTTIIIGDSAGVKDRWSAEEINEEIERIVGYRLKIERSRSYSGEIQNIIIIGERSLNDLITKVVERDRLRPESMSEAYLLHTTPDRIVLCGADQRGTFWAAQTLKELMRPNEDSIVVPSSSVRDWPVFEFRGVYMLASGDATDYYIKLIERVFSRLKINHLVLQADRVEWDSHPEVRDPEHAISKADLKRILQAAERHHIQVTPKIQCLGHLEWAFRDGANIDIAEDKKTPYALCPSNPRSYEFIFSIIDEALDLFERPEWFHAGLDEFDMRGEFPSCEECKKVGKAELYARNMRSIHDHLTEQGVKMMMWGDVLPREGFAEKVDTLPKDILVNDWRYTANQKFTSLDFLQGKGFDVVAATWYDPLNIYRFSEAAARNGIKGMLQTTWTNKCNEEFMLCEKREQVYAYILAADWFWTPGLPAFEDMPFEADEVFHELWTEGKQKSPTCNNWFTVQLAPYCNIATADSGRWVGWVGVGNGNDLRALRPGIRNLNGVPFEVLPCEPRRAGAVMVAGTSMTTEFPTAVRGIKVGAKAKALYFLHTAAYSGGKDQLVGEYIIRYVDGTEKIVSLIYGKNIAAWDENHPAMTYNLCWRGKTADGRVIRLRTLKWMNDSPEKEIASIDFVSEPGNQAAPVLLAISGEAI